MRNWVVKPSIIDVCAGHLIGDDIVTQGTLLIVPFTRGTPCGDGPDHSKGLKAFLASTSAAIVATVKRNSPKDAGRMQVHFQAIARTVTVFLTTIRAYICRTC
jgi:hypothetical protein